MVSLVARVWWCCCGVLCCLGGWWGPLVDVDDTPGDFDAVGAMVCGVVVSTLGRGPGGRRWWRLFSSRGGVLGVVVDGGALGITLCRMHTKVMPPTSMQKLMLVPGRNEADNSLY